MGTIRGFWTLGLLLLAVALMGQSSLWPGSKVSLDETTAATLEACLVSGECPVSATGTAMTANKCVRTDGTGKLIVHTDLCGVGGGGDATHQFGAGAPTTETCSNVGADRYTDTTSDTEYYCSATDTWTIYAGAGGGGALDDLSDVTLTTPATGATLVKSAGDWVDGQLDLADSDAITGVLPDGNVAGSIARDSETCGGGACAVGTDDTITFEEQGAADPTIDGRAEWDSTTETFKIGDDGVATHEFFPADHTTDTGPIPDCTATQLQAADGTCPTQAAVGNAATSWQPTDADLDDLADGSLSFGKVGGATASRCARFDASGDLIPASADCPDGDTGSAPDIDSVTGQANWGTAATKETADLTINGVEVDFHNGAAAGYPLLSKQTTCAATACDIAGETGRLCFDTDADTDGSVMVCAGAGPAWKEIDDDGGAGGFTSWDLDGDNNSPQTISDGNEALIAGGAGIATIASATDTVTVATASGEADFLASGALTCGASTQGKAQVHTTPLQYCDNAATPALQYAAYGDSSGNATGVVCTNCVDASDVAADVATQAEIDAQDECSEITGCVVSAITSAGVTYENLDANGDIGFGATQVPQGSAVCQSDGTACDATQAELDLKANLGGGTTFTGNVIVENSFDIGTVETFGNPDTTPDVSTGVYWTTNTVNNTITDFDGTPESGELLVVLASDGGTVLDCTASQLECGTADITMAANDVATFIAISATIWTLIAYVDQADDLGVDASGGAPATADITDVSVTQTELAELETIDATVISAANWTALAALAGTNTDDEAAATTGVPGISELADVTETQAGTDTGRTVTPDGLNSATIGEDGAIPDSGTLTECVTLHAEASIQPAAETSEIALIEGTNFPYKVVNFDDTLDEIITWNYELPANIAGTTATVRIAWLTLACTAATADDVCFVWNGGGFQDDDAFNSGAFSGTEIFVQDKCTTVGDVHTSAATSWTHGYDVASPKDTQAVFQIQREQVADASCTGDNDDISGDAQLKAIQICYEVTNVASGEDG